MVKPELVRRWKVEKAARIVAMAISEFSKSGADQVNLAAPSAQKSLAEKIAITLKESGCLGRFSPKDDNQ